MHGFRVVAFLMFMLGVAALGARPAQALTVHIVGADTVSGYVGQSDSPSYSFAVTGAPMSDSECTVGNFYHWDPPKVSDSTAVTASLSPERANTGSVSLNLSFLKVGDYTVTLHGKIGFVSNCGNAEGEDTKIIQVHVEAGQDQLDAQVGNTDNPTMWAGENVINATGQGQEMSQKVDGNRKAVYYFKFWYSKAFHDTTFDVSLPDWSQFKAGGWDARFYDAGNGGNDITEAITGSKGWSFTVVPQDHVVATFRAEVTIPASATEDQVKSFLVRSQVVDSRTSPPVDVVKATVVLPATPAMPDVSLESLSDGQSVESVGESILNDDANETLSTVVALGQAQNYHVHIKNTGKSAATFTVKMQLPLVAGAAPQPWAHQGWSASITLDGQTQDLASQLQSDSGWTTPSINAGGEAVLDLSVSSTADAATSLDGSFRIVAQNGTLSDAVVGQLTTQSIVKIQWSLDNGQTWNDVTSATTLDADQFAVVGLRAVKSNPSAGWPSPMMLGPTWKFQGQEVEGEEVWLHAKQVAQGEAVEVTPSGSPTVTIRVAPGDATLTYDAQ